MPISKERLALYPKDWPAISRRIRDRSGGQCEFTIASTGLRCAAINGQPHPDTGSKVILTVAHLDHDPPNVADDNLLAGCQRCHLNYDRANHVRNARETRRRRMQTAELFTQENPNG